MTAAVQYVPTVAAPLPRADFALFVRAYFEAISLTAADIVAPAPDFAWEDMDDHWRGHVTYSVEADERGVAWLLKPKAAPRDGGTLYPLVLALHPTHILGKDVTLGLYPDAPATALEADKREWRAYALDLVRRGYGVFAPDRAGYGERVPASVAGTTSFEVSTDAYDAEFRLRHPAATSLVGKAAWDLARALDFLTTLDFIDATRIGVLGFSLGAWDSFTLAAYEGWHGQRLKAAAANGGPGLAFDRGLYTDPDYLRTYLSAPMLERPSDTRDSNILAMLIAPTPLLVIRGLNDPSYMTGMVEPGWPDAVKTVTDYYLAKRLVGRTALNQWRAPFSVYSHSDNHSFLPDAKALAYAWLDRHLYR